MISVTGSSSFLGIGSVLAVAPATEYATSLLRTLSLDGFESKRLQLGVSALDALRQEWVDALVIIGEPPDIGAPALCRLVRHEPEVCRIPIIGIGPSRPAGEIVTLLRAGADDYMSDNLDVAVIIARLKSILRRSSWAESEQDVDFERHDKLIRIGEILIRPARYAVHVSGRPVELTASEFRILMLLAARPNEVVRREHVFEAVHRLDSDATDRSLDSHIYGIRRKLGIAGHYVETVRGVGYRIVNGSPRLDV